MVHTAQRPPSRAPRRAPNPAGRNTNRPRYEGTCAACGKYGHEAVRCDMLGMAVFIQRYSTKRENADAIKEAENRWMERNKPFLPRDSRSPGTILANYCAEMGFDDTQVEDELDWDYLAVNSVVDDDLE